MTTGKNAILCAAVWGVVGLAAAPAGAELIYATANVSGTAVISRFDSGSLATANVTSVPVVGLQVGETLVDIDVRPYPTSPGVQSLYGIGTTNRMYIINPVTGQATQIGT